jgi:hypothetical protein
MKRVQRVSGTKASAEARRYQSFGLMLTRLADAGAAVLSRAVDEGSPRNPRLVS